MKDFLSEYFSFSRTERNGIIFLLVLILLAILTLIYLKNRTITPSLSQQVIQSELDRLSQLTPSDRQQSTNSFQDSLWHSKKPTEQAAFQDDQPNSKQVFTAQKKTYNKQDYKAQEKKIITFDLNSASLDQMVASGTREWLAKRIVKYRSILGGYHSKEQLKEVYGMKASNYQWIVKRANVNQPFTLKKIDLKNADFKTILKHPYVEYEQVKSIMQLRKENKLDNSSVKSLFSNTIYAKLVPYLKFD